MDGAITWPIAATILGALVALLSYLKSIKKGKDIEDSGGHTLKEVCDQVNNHETSIQVMQTDIKYIKAGQQKHSKQIEAVSDKVMAVSEKVVEVSNDQYNKIKRLLDGKT
jgi:gas vesicle protein